MQRSINELKTGRAALTVPHPLYRHHNRFHHQFNIHVIDGNPFTIMPFNANDIGNKLTELGELLERHNVKVTVIQESKLSSNFRTPSIQNFTTVRKDRRQGQGGGLLTLIHRSINLSRRPESPETLAGVAH